MLAPDAVMSHACPSSTSILMFTHDAVIMHDGFPPCVPPIASRLVAGSSTAVELAALTRAGCGQDQLCTARSQRAKLSWLSQVCQAISAGKPTEWLHGQRHHCHPIHHRAGCVLWRGTFWPQSPWQPRQAICHPGRLAVMHKYVPVPHELWCTL